MTYQKIEAIRRRIDAVNPAIRLRSTAAKIDNIELSKRPARLPLLLAPLYSEPMTMAQSLAMRQAMN